MYYRGIFVAYSVLAGPNMLWSSKIPEIPCEDRYLDPLKAFHLRRCLWGSNTPIQKVWLEESLFTNQPEFRLLGASSHLVSG